MLDREALFIFLFLGAFFSLLTPFVQSTATANKMRLREAGRRGGGAAGQRGPGSSQVGDSASSRRLTPGTCSLYRRLRWELSRCDGRILWPAKPWDLPVLLRPYGAPGGAEANSQVQHRLVPPLATYLFFQGPKVSLSYGHSLFGCR